MLSDKQQDTEVATPAAICEMAGRLMLGLSCKNTRNGSLCVIYHDAPYKHQHTSTPGPSQTFKGLHLHLLKRPRANEILGVILSTHRRLVERRGTPTIKYSLNRE